MARLRFHQDTLLFFLILLLLLQLGLSSMQFSPVPSNPLIGVSAPPQKDGGFLR